MKYTSDNNIKYTAPVKMENKQTRTDFNDNYYRIDNMSVSNGNGTAAPYVQHNISYEPKRNFTKIDNDIINSDKITLEAKGLYMILMQKIHIPGFVLCRETAFNCCKNGAKAFMRVWNELKELGFLKLYRIRYCDNKFHYEYELLSVPDTSRPCLINVRLSKMILDERDNSIIKHFVNDSEKSENDEFVFEYITDEETARGIEDDAEKSLTAEEAEIPAVIDEDMDKVYDVYEGGEHGQENANPQDCEIMRQVKYNIEYEYYKITNDRIVLPYLDSILSSIMYVMRYNKPILNIGSQAVPIEEARAKMTMITSSHIDYVCKCLADNRKPIKNIRSYLIAALLSAVDSIDMYYDNLYNSSLLF